MPKVLYGETASGILKASGLSPQEFLKLNPNFAAKGGKRDYLGLSGDIQAGWEYNLPTPAKTVVPPTNTGVVETKPIQPPVMNSLTSTGQQYLKVRQDSGLPADELSIKKLYRDRGFEDKYGEWRGNEAQYKSMWLQDIQEGVNKVNDRIATEGITDDQGKVLQQPTRNADGSSISNVPTEEFKNPTGDDYIKMTDEILSKIGTTDMAKLIQDFSGGTLSTPELEMSKEERDAKLEELKGAAAAGLATIQKNLATRGMTFSSIRSDAEVGFAADTLAKESGINREFAGELLTPREANKREGKRHLNLRSQITMTPLKKWVMCIIQLLTRLKKPLQGKTPKNRRSKITQLHTMNGN